MLFEDQNFGAETGQADAGGQTRKPGADYNLIVIPHLSGFQILGLTLSAARCGFSPYQV
jgi:hypothetical protein